MTGDFAAAANFDAFLDFDEIADLDIITDLTAIEIDHTVDANAFTQLDIGGDLLIWVGVQSRTGRTGRTGRTDGTDGTFRMGSWLIIGRAGKDPRPTIGGRRDACPTKFWPG